MLRSILWAALAALLSAPTLAQLRLDPARMHPVTVPVRDGGVFDWATKRWLSGPAADRQLASSYTVYRNTCTWTGGGFYFGVEHCEDLVDNGRLPSATTPLRSLPGMDANGLHVQSGVALSGATDDQIISSFQFAYCTGYPTGAVDVKIGFYDKLRGFCAAGIPVQGKPYNLTLASQAIPFGTLTAYFDFGAPAGFSLPGSTTYGNLACWTITITVAGNAGFCMASEGEGTWDNNDDTDEFTWSFEHDMVTSTALGVTSGPLIAGEPLSGGWGAGSYNIPVGSNALFGTCGTGFGAGDGFWNNVDLSAPGAFATTGAAFANCPAGPGGGTGCYWFGGWPGAPLASFWMVMNTTGSCSGCSNRAVNYCTAGSSTSGCTALISASGSSSATAATGFYLSASGVEGGKDGLFFYGANGRQANSWGNGTSFQCVVPPVNRGGLLAGVGTTGSCDGSATQDLNARWTAKPNQSQPAGTTVQGQFWYRDPQNTSNQTTSLSNAIEWTVCP